MKVENNRVICIHYTLTDVDGEVLDSSTGRDPLSYLHGAGNIIPGLEKALTDKGIGDQLNVTIQPEDAYGPVVPELISIVPKSAFQVGEEVKPGMQFQAEGQGGQVQRITVKSVSDEGIEIDANHPLAGQVLKFDVTVDSIREATPEELEHRHVH